MENYVSYRFGAGRYFQEKDLLRYSGEEVLRYGKRAYVVGGTSAFQIVRNKIAGSFKTAGLESVWEEYCGYPSHLKIEELKNEIEVNQCDVLVGVGGGRIMDLMKAVAAELKLPAVLIPTSAATCAAFSPLSVIYTKEGRRSSRAERCVLHFCEITDGKRGRLH